MFKGKLQLPGSNMDEDYYQNYISIHYTKENHSKLINMKLLKLLIE